MAQLTYQELHEIIEIAVDEEVLNFDSEANIYERYGMDSIGAVAMVVEIQRRFGVALPEKCIPMLLTPRQVLEAVNAHLEGTVD